MIPAMIASKDHLMDHLTARVDSNGCVEVDMQDLTTRTALDAFTRSALGIETDVLENVNNEFKVATDDSLAHMNGMGYTASWAVAAWPRLMKLVFGLAALSVKVAKFFEELLLDVAEARERSQVQRMDALGMVVNVKNPPGDDDKLSSKFKSLNFKQDLNSLSILCE